jgi:hypothetical protein
MRLGPLLSSLGLGLAVLAGACSPASDLGKPCPISPDAGGIALGTGDDFVYNGDAFCQNLVCLRPSNWVSDAGTGWGFCSNTPCTPDNTSGPMGGLNTASQDCNSSSTGLVCNTLTADPAFVATIDAEDGGAALLAQYLGTTYCTTPQ